MTQSVNISKEIIEQCNINYMLLEELIFLYTLFIQEDWDIRIFPASLTKLKREGFISKDDELTEKGETFVNEVLKPTIVREEKAEIDFESFWQAFPKDDEHGMFVKTRAIRVNKAAAEKEYRKTLAEGITEEYLLKCLQLEVAWRKTFMSSNFLTYIKSPTNWLSSKAYLDIENYELDEPNDPYGKDVI